MLWLIVMLMLPVLLLYAMGLDSVEMRRRAELHIVSTSIYGIRGTSDTSSQQYYSTMGQCIILSSEVTTHACRQLQVNMFLLLLLAMSHSMAKTINDMESCGLQPPQAGKNRSC
jgi:hypothetical protein